MHPKISMNLLKMKQLRYILLFVFEKAADTEAFKTISLVALQKWQ